MAKTKETPWTEQKVLYKDGNVDVYRKFGWETWKRMTEGERAMWTELNEATPAPISKEVIDFNRKMDDKVVKPKSKANSNGLDPIIMSAPITDAAGQKVGTGDGGVLDIIEAEKDAIKKQLKKLGIRFTHNSKFETLRKKLADADNTE